MKIVNSDRECNFHGLASQGILPDFVSRKMRRAQNNVKRHKDNRINCLYSAVATICFLFSSTSPAQRIETTPFDADSPPAGAEYYFATDLSNLSDPDLDAFESYVSAVINQPFLSEDQKKSLINQAAGDLGSVYTGQCAQQLDGVINGLSLASDGTALAGDIVEAIGAIFGLAGAEVPGIVIQAAADGMSLASSIVSEKQSGLPNCNTDFTGTIRGFANISAGQGISAFDGKINIGNADGISYQGGIALGGGSLSGAGLSGHEAQALDPTAIAIGNDAVGGAPNATALGEGAIAEASNSTAIGAFSSATNAGATAIGYSADALGINSIAIGTDARTDATNGIAIGTSSKVSGAGSIAIGANAEATGTSSVAIGEGSIAAANNVVSVGNAVTQRRITYVAAGIDPLDAVNVSQLQTVADAQANTQAALNITNTNVTLLTEGKIGIIRTDNTSAAAETKALGPNSLAAGPGAVTNGEESVAIGNSAIAENTATTVLGVKAKAQGDNATVIGHEAIATASNSVVLGANSSDEGQDDVVSVGTSQSRRRVINVANAVAPNDAVNLNQLVMASDFTLMSANAYTDLRALQLNHQIKTVRRDADAATASAMALDAIPQPIEAGKNFIGIGTGVWQGQKAVAIGASRVSDDGKFTIKVGATYNSRKKGGASAGAGFSF